MVLNVLIKNENPNICGTQIYVRPLITTMVVYFQPLEVVGRGSEKQLQVAEYLDIIGNEMCVQTSRFANVWSQLSKYK